MDGGKVASEMGNTAAGADRNRAGEDGRMVVGGAGGRRRRRATCRGAAGSAGKARGAAAVCDEALPLPPLQPRRRRGGAPATSAEGATALTKSRGGDDDIRGVAPAARRGNDNPSGRRHRGSRGRPAGATNVVVMARSNPGAGWPLLVVKVDRVRRGSMYRSVLRIHIDTPAAAMRRPQPKKPTHAATVGASSDDEACRVRQREWRAVPRPLRVGHKERPRAASAIMATRLDTCRWQIFSNSHK